MRFYRLSKSENYRWRGAKTWRKDIAVPTGDRATSWLLDHPRRLHGTGESAEEGALREAYEEATVRLKIDGLLAIYSIPHISQVQLIYRTTLVDAHFAPGIESLEVALFDWDDIPWDELAFPSVKWALEQAREVWGGEPHPPFGNPEI